MLFENLSVDRIVVHEVFQRGHNNSLVPPAYGDQLEILDVAALGVFRMRMTQALSGQSQSIQMDIARARKGNFLPLAEALVGIPDSEFPAASRAIADRLAESQLARRIPGGMLIVFDGHIGSPAVPFVGVVKAETQAGFRRSHNRKGVIVEFLQNIFLTPATRLYKIGLVLFDDQKQKSPKGRRAFVFDSNITASNREAAAVYFYDAFLGCSLPSDGAYETSRFFDLTKEFIRKSSLDPERKRDLIDSLFVFVRDEQDATFTTDQFGDRYLPPQMRDAFTQFMRSKRFTSNAVVRDTANMGRRLRRRKLRFGTDIELSASPQALADKVKIEPIDGVSVDGEPQRWTRLTIHEPLTGEQ